MPIVKVRKEDGFHCFYCNTRVSESAERCPGCGREFSKPEPQSNGTAKASGERSVSSAVSGTVYGASAIHGKAIATDLPKSLRVYGVLNAILTAAYSLLFWGGVCQYVCSGDVNLLTGQRSISPLPVIGGVALAIVVSVTAWAWIRYHDGLRWALITVTVMGVLFFASAVVMATSFGGGGPLQCLRSRCACSMPSALWEDGGIGANSSSSSSTVHYSNCCHFR